MANGINMVAPLCPINQHANKIGEEMDRGDVELTALEAAEVKHKKEIGKLKAAAQEAKDYQRLLSAENKELSSQMKASSEFKAFAIVMYVTLYSRECYSLEADVVGHIQKAVEEVAGVPTTSLDFLRFATSVYKGLRQEVAEAKEKK